MVTATMNKGREKDIRKKKGMRDNAEERNGSQWPRTLHNAGTEVTSGYIYKRKLHSGKYLYLFSMTTFVK